jgi:hypothetical protein
MNCLVQEKIGRAMVRHHALGLAKALDAARDALHVPATSETRGYEANKQPCANDWQQKAKKYRQEPN